MKQKNKNLADALISVGIANACHLKAWSGLFQARPGIASPDAIYLLPHSSGFHFLAVSLDIILLSVVFWTLLRLAKTKNHSHIVHVVMALTLLLPLNYLRHHFLPSWSHHLPHFLMFGLVGIAIYFAGKHLDTSTKAIRKAGLCLLPAIFVVIFDFGYTQYRTPITSAVKPARKAAVAANEKVLWMVFDEMAQDFAITDRPAGLKLPELDRLIDESILFENAYPPSSRTMTSMPAYLIGEKVVQATPTADGSDLLFTTESSRLPRRWTKTPGLMAEAKTLGYETSIIGSYHPYCRILAPELDSCYLFGQSDSRGSLLHEMSNQFVSLLPNNVPKQYEGLYDKMFEEVVKNAKRLQPSVTMVHWPFPHSPWMLDPQTKRFTGAVHDRMKGYVGNLLLVDRTIGKLREEMEAAGTWDLTTIIITSDHWWRAAHRLGRVENHRVPLIIKRRGQKIGRRISDVYQTVELKKYILEVLSDRESQTREFAGLHY